MAAHLLYLDGIECNGYPRWRLTCEHAAVELAREWRSTMLNSEPDPDWDGCWLRSWWDEVGSELLEINQPIHSFPIPVKPGDDWSEDGGSIVLDGVHAAPYRGTPK